MVAPPVIVDSETSTGASNTPPAGLICGVAASPVTLIVNVSLSEADGDPIGRRRAADGPPVEGRALDLGRGSVSPVVEHGCGQLHVALKLTRDVEHLDLRVRVLQVVGQEAIADQRNGPQRMTSLAAEISYCVVDMIQRTKAAEAKRIAAIQGCPANTN